MRLNSKVIRQQIVSFLLLALVIGSSLIGLCELIVVIPLLLVLSLNKHGSRIELLYCFIVACLFVLLIKARVVVFPMFPQAAELFSMNEDLFYWLKTGHVHAIRLAIVYPGVIISRLCNLDVDYGVTIYSSAIMILIMYMMLRILKQGKMEKHICAIMSAFVVLALSYFMNGRLIFVFFGVSLLALYELKYQKGETGVINLMLITAVGVFFSMVSSGTMMISIAYAILIIPYRWGRLRSKREKVLFVAIIFLAAIPAVGILLPYVIKMVMKNVNYFGGGFQGAINMIQHGIGKYVNTENKVLVLSLLLGGAIAVIANIRLFKKKIANKDNPNLPLFLLVNLSIYGSVFGLSTGLTSLIPFMVLMIETVNKHIKYV